MTAEPQRLSGERIRKLTAKAGIVYRILIIYGSFSFCSLFLWDLILSEQYLSYKYCRWE